MFKKLLQLLRGAPIADVSTVAHKLYVNAAHDSDERVQRHIARIQLCKSQIAATGEIEPWQSEINSRLAELASRGFYLKGVE